MADLTTYTPRAYQTGDVVIAVYGEEGSEAPALVDPLTIGLLGVSKISGGHPDFDPNIDMIISGGSPT